MLMLLLCEIYIDFYDIYDVFIYILQPYLEEIKRTINGTIFDKFIER